MTNLINLKNILEEQKEDVNYIFNAFVYKPIKKRSQNGIAFISCYLRDKNDVINAKKWNVDSIDEKHLKHGNVLRISAKTNFYNGTIQLIIKSTELIKNKEIFLEVLPTAPYSIEKMWKEFKYFVNEIKDEDYKKIFNEIFTDEIIEKFKETKAGLFYHHDVVGGLLWHTLSILKTSEKIIEVYDYIKVDKSLLYLGIIFHDFGKIYEMGDFLQETYSFQGTLIGHISIGSSLVYEIGMKLKIPIEKIFKLQHLILSSHGKLENGSPIEPKLIESFLLSNLDNLDAKINAIFKGIKNIPVGKFSEKIKILNNSRIFVSESNKE